MLKTTIKWQNTFRLCRFMPVSYERIKFFLKRRYFVLYKIGANSCVFTHRRWSELYPLGLGLSEAIGPIQQDDSVSTPCWTRLGSIGHTLCKLKWKRKRWSSTREIIQPLQGDTDLREAWVWMSRIKTKPVTCTSERKMARLWTCTLCVFACLFLKDLLTHLNSEHREDSGFCRTCGLPDCTTDKEHTSANSLVKHVRTKHGSLLLCTWEDVFPGVTQGS